MKAFLPILASCCLLVPLSATYRYEGNMAIVTSLATAFFADRRPDIPCGKSRPARKHRHCPRYLRWRGLFLRDPKTGRKADNSQTAGLLERDNSPR
jgi:hypothetical protein